MYFWISAFDHRAIVVPKMHIVHWWVNHELGKKDGWLRAEVVKEDPLVPPINGWWYKYCGWKSDETLECSRTVSAVCAEVRIELVVTQ